MSERAPSKRRRGRSSHARTGGPRLGWRGLVIIACTLGFGALIVVRTLGEDVQDRVIDTSLRFETASYEDLPAIAADARTVLADSPLDARAMRILALVTERQGANDRAMDLMRTAWKLSRRDDSVDWWLYQQARQRRQYAEAFLHVDAVMRRRPDSLSPMFAPVLATLADPAALEPMAARMAYNPDWRWQFLGFLSDRVPESAFALMATTRKLGSPPSERELSYYLGRMVENRRYQEAYANWAALRPTSLGSNRPYVNNGDFSGVDSEAPFGWDFEGNVLGSIERATAHGRDENALRAEYDGSSQARFPQQMVVLPPGRYRLTGDALTANPESAGTLEWVVACVDGAIIARSPTVDTGMAWRRFAVDFETPAEGCGAQWLRLKTIRADQRSTVEAWYDKLSIIPLSAG